jgi:hypothetical protein
VAYDVVEFIFSFRLVVSASTWNGDFLGVWGLRGEGLGFRGFPRGFPRGFRLTRLSFRDCTFRNDDFDGTYPPIFDACGCNGAIKP